MSSSFKDPISCLLSIDEVERIELTVPGQDREFTYVTATVGTGTVFEFVKQYL